MMSATAMCAGAAAGGGSPFALVQQAARAPAAKGDAATPARASPPASSCSTGTALGSQGASSGAQSAAHAATGGREWLYRLVTFPAYFTPCHGCCGGSRAPKREQLMTQFDTQFPYRVYCSHCPECKARAGTGALLQVRRSAFKDVVKATDLGRFGADVAGVQQYTLNGSKVIYLNREQTPERKGAGASTAPAACSVDGRAMMDKSSQYCSLKCKMTAEDPGFTTWLDAQDPSVRILAAAAANAPPRPTLASKRTATPSSSDDSSGGSGACCSERSGASSGGAGGATSGRPRKLARTSSGAQSAFSQPQPAAAAAAPAAPRAGAAAPAPGGAPRGLKPVRTALPAGGRRQASAPSALALAAADNAAGDAGDAAAWLPGCSLDAALSCSEPWVWGCGLEPEDGLDSPCFAAMAGSPADNGAWAEAGADDSALITARPAGGLASSSDCWLAASPDSAFAAAGMGALLLPGGSLDDSLMLGDSCTLSGAALAPLLPGQC